MTIGVGNIKDGVFYFSLPDEGEKNNDLNRDVLLEVVHDEQYTLSYTIFLIPDQPSVKLTDDFVEPLSNWVEQICAANDWVLEFVTVETEYLQWALLAPPAISTSQIIQETRSKLSEQILSTFSELLDSKELTDFWADGYLLLHGLHPHPGKIMERYIQIIREQQLK